MLKKPLILHPFLFSVYPVLFLYSHNIEELVFSDVSTPLAVAFFASLILYFLVRVLVKDRATSALITAVAVVFFFSYGAFFDAVSSIGFPARERYMLSAFLLMELCVIYVLVKARTKPFAKKITPALNAIAIILVCFSLSNILFFTFKQSTPVVPKSLVAQKLVSSPSSKPDIYYIILDEYLRPDKMNEIFGYDDAEFTDHLKQLGFFIAEKSESRWGSTLYSLASSLNMTYVQPLETELFEAMKMIQNNEVSDFLQSQGYKTVIFNNSNSTTGTAEADYNFSYDGSDDAQKINFYQIIVKNSMAKPFFAPSTSHANPVFALSRGTTLFTLSKVLELDEVPSPKFVFAHIVSPHLPFVFNRKGGYVDPSHEDDWENKQYYRDQYIYISSRIQEIVDELLLQYKDNPPIIIIQGDHGIRKNYLWEGKKKSISYVALDTWKYIFNAYYLPGFEGAIPSDISPAQTFDLIFSHYFNRPK